MSDIRILVIDDEPDMLRYMQTLLEINGCEVLAARSGAQAIEIISSGAKPHLVFLDLVMPGMDGIEVLPKLRAVDPSLHVIVVSCVNETAKIVQCMKLGAQDFLNKPFRAADLESVLARFHHAADASQPDLGKDYHYEEIDENTFFVAAAPKMLAIHEQITPIAAAEVPVLLLGESGTGKEVLARLIHARSPRANETFLKVNCAALPADLLESELFGYEAGAFTGAAKTKPGKFELANNGTLFLDELGEMAPHLQAKLLHTLQDGEYTPLGSRRTRKSNARVVAATNINIEQSIQDRSFREDLYYRLNTFCIEIPPLRHRREDIPVLLSQTMSRMSARFGGPHLTLSKALVDAAVAAEWRGNVRELHSFVKRFLILQDEEAALRELQSQPKAQQVATIEPTQGSSAKLRIIGKDAKMSAEYEAIERALAQSGGNRRAAAKMLNISYRSLMYKMRDHRLQSPRATSHGRSRLNA